MSDKSRQLETRLISFSNAITDLAERLPKSTWGNNIADQIIRSGTSAVLNYAESRGAQSLKDFLHKMRLTLKELRETYSSLLLIQAKQQNYFPEESQRVLNECNELISIFVKSTKTIETRYF